MQQLESLLAQIIEKKKSLDELRAQSPEMAEVLAVSDEYHGLMNDLREMCNPPAPAIMPMYPARPFWESPAIYTADNTADKDRPKLRLMIDGREISRI